MCIFPTPGAQPTLCKERTETAETGQSLWYVRYVLCKRSRVTRFRCFVRTRVIPPTSNDDIANPSTSKQSIFVLCVWVTLRGPEAIFDLVA